MDPLACLVDPVLDYAPNQYGCSTGLVLLVRDAELQRLERAYRIHQSVNMSPVSTNVDVNSTQILDWSVNIWGATQQMSMLPTLGEYETIYKKFF